MARLQAFVGRDEPKNGCEGGYGRPLSRQFSKKSHHHREQKNARGPRVTAALHPLR